MSVTRNGSTHKLSLRKGTRLAATTLGSGGLTLGTGVAKAGTYSLRALLTRVQLVKGRPYVVRLTATNAAGRVTSLIIHFRA